VEQWFRDYLRDSVLVQIELTIRDAIGGEVRRAVETSGTRASEAEAVALAQAQRLRAQLTAGELREVLTILFPAGSRVLWGLVSGQGERI
jgi:hypothetical protein